jgi:hypothetical protein
MRRRISAVVLGLFAALALAGPAFADTTPGGPGENFRQSGDALYLNAFGGTCDGSTCTDTFISGYIVEFNDGTSITEVCVDQFTYAARTGRFISSFFGCAPVAPDIAEDTSSASAEVTVQGDRCGRRTCTSDEVSVSLSLTAVGDPNSYSFSQKNEFGTCVDTVRVRGESSDAEGPLTVDGVEMVAFGQIGSESFAVSTRCR